MSDTGASSPVLFRVVSDLHLEFWLRVKVNNPQPAALPHHCDVIIANAPRVPYLLLCGDVCPMKRYLKPSLKVFFEKMRSAYDQVFYVLGNHEYYNTHMDKALAMARELAEETGVVLLDNDHYDLSISTRNASPLRILGTTLWSHITGPDFEAARELINDYQCIRDGTTYRKLRPRYTNIKHIAAVRWLETQLAECKRLGLKAVVISHHLPIETSKGTVSTAYGTDLSHLMDSTTIKVWFHGHTHVSGATQVKGVPIISNQCGYSDQVGTGFDPAFVFPITPI